MSLNVSEQNRSAHFPFFYLLFNSLFIGITKRRGIKSRLSTIPLLCKKMRKKETEEHMKFYNEENIPIIGKIIGSGTVEGGDCLWINNKTLIVGESYRTNKYGIDQLSTILKAHDIKLIPIKLPKYNNKNSCFHLMSLISMLDDDLAIGCFSLFPLDLINLLSEVSGKNINPKFKLKENAGTKRRKPDISKAKSVGYIPKIALRNGLKITYDWYSKFYKNN